MTALAGLVTLFDMLEFIAEHFVVTVTKLAGLEKVLTKGQRTDLLSPDSISDMQAEIALFGTSCIEYGLLSSVHQCGRIGKNLEEKKLTITCGELHDDLKQLRQRIEDDLKSEIFLKLSVQEGKLYQYPIKDWELVIQRFPRVRNDVEECSKCYALERYAASLFHVLLVAEFGVIEVSKLFGVEGDKPGWSALDRLTKIHEKKWSEKNSLEKKYTELLKELLPLAYAMKDSWRHKISHVDNKLVWMDTDFSPRVAEEIISASRGFMRRLARDLPQ